MGFLRFAAAVLSLRLSLAGPVVSPRALTSGVNTVTCFNSNYTYQQLAGYGFVPSDARDKYNDTIGGIGSSIAFNRTSWTKVDGVYTGVLWALPDRGWNTQGTLNYQNRVHKFAVKFTPTSSYPSPPNLQLSYLDTILFTGPDGTPTTSLDADPTGYITYPGFPILPVATYTGDGFGSSGPTTNKRISIDSEGLVLNDDGTFFVSDEYGPYIYKFSATGLMLQAIAPPGAYIPQRNGAVSFSSNTGFAFTPPPSPPPSPKDTTCGRNNNQGLEGLTKSTDGKYLYAMMQSALDQEGGPNNPYRRQARVLQYDITGSVPQYVAEYVVTLPYWYDPTEKASKQQKVAAQSEIQSLGNGRFLILVRDSGSGRAQPSTTSQFRHVDLFNIGPGSGATNIKSDSNDAVCGAIASSTGVLKQGITPAAYCSFLDYNINSELGKFGLHNGGAQDAGLLNEKWESLALVPVDGKDGADGLWYLFSLSDNDFITKNGFLEGGAYTYSDPAGNVDNQALVFQIQLP
ncbi:hypothetical protein MMC07_008330 [Pseudocyphellaria aurata]|nr:hypothetical protein [Pseudocyphellaria aurata]